MRNEVPNKPRSGFLIYDSHCRLCVTVKRKLEQCSEDIQFVPYESQKAAECLGKSHQPGCRPSMAYWVDEKGAVIGGLEAFLPFLHGLTGGKIFMFFWRFRAWRQITIALYEFVAKHRYRWFGVSEKS